MKRGTNWIRIEIMLKFKYKYREINKVYIQFQLEWAIPYLYRRKNGLKCERNNKTIKLSTSINTQHVRLNNVVSSLFINYKLNTVHFLNLLFQKKKLSYD